MPVPELRCDKFAAYTMEDRLNPGLQTAARMILRSQAYCIDEYYPGMEDPHVGQADHGYMVPEPDMPVPSGWKA